MMIIPAVDLKGGQCVRLLHGDKNKETVYSKDPVEMAQRWVKAGAERLHVIDLDGAFEGSSQNLEWAQKIKEETGVVVQFGGGLRTLEAIEMVLNKGIDKVILGTILFTDDQLAKAVFQQFGTRVMVAMDVRGDQISIKGWESSSGLTVKQGLERIEKYGGNEIIFTDINRDGTLKGVNISSVENLMKITNIRVIASGGVSTMDDIEALLAIGSPACIVGKSIYEGTLDLKTAIQRSKTYAR